ncbi:MAG: DNA mismatch repair endonuclease MutL, partial [Spirochaeta sp.]|nr:DNA mismatch repair endonuclease MutL [Spirochaeta sp.]
SRPQAETTAIRNVIRDKAAPFPEVRFTFQSESGSRTVLPRQDLITRVADLFGNVAPLHALREVTGSGDGFALHIVTAEPEIVRRDRRYIRVFVNKRRVWEYRLIQAVEYAFQDVQHGGLFPVAAVFLEIDPELVDFNIHPAKREVRIRPVAEVHHRIVELLRSFLRAYTIRTVQMDRDFPAWSPPAAAAERPSDGPRQPHDHRSPGTRWTSAPSTGGLSGTPPREFPSFRPDVRAVPPGRSLQENAPATAAEEPGERDDHDRARQAASAEALIYQGTIFGTYIIVEYDDRAYLIDQHAAHERLLYNHLREHRTSQPLLVPEEFTVTEDQDGLLSRHVDDYGKLGISVERVGECRWSITAVPPHYGTQMEAIVETLVELDGLHEAADRTFLAELACKAAVKGGDFVDGLTALELARRTLALETPRCPHGRPLWVELERRHLERLIGRA